MSDSGIPEINGRSGICQKKKKDKISHDETIPAEILSPFILLYLFFYITYTLYNNKYVNSIGFWEIDKLGK